MEADTPGLDALAECGRCGLVKSVPDGVELNPPNAVAAILGYDFARGPLDPETLGAYGRGEGLDPTKLRFWVIPKFSGHGVVMSDNDEVRGVGMSALLRPLFAMDSETHQPKHPATGTLADKAMGAVKIIENYDFVVLYVDDVLKAGLEGDLQGKIEAIEDIDRELIRPIADHVWGAKEQMSLIVTGDYSVSYQLRTAIEGDVPAAVYFNDDLPGSIDKFDEEAFKEGPLSTPLPGDLIRDAINFE